MSDYSVKTIADYSLPPVHWDGIRLSGDGVDRGKATALDDYLKITDTHEVKDGVVSANEAPSYNYGESSFYEYANQTGALDHRAFVNNNSIDIRYFHYVGNYDSGFPFQDSSRNYSCDDLSLNYTTYADINKYITPKFWLNGGGEFVASSPYREILLFRPAYITSGNYLYSSISEVASVGWGDTTEDLVLRFSPQLKAGLVNFGASRTTNEEINDLYQKYQFDFLVENDCDEVEIEFSVVNEHPLIKWEFDMGVCINRRNISSFELDTFDEELFIYSPKTGDGTGILASGYYGSSALSECSLTKYRATIKNIDTYEGAGLVQIQVNNIDFNSRGEDYIPKSLYDKITSTGFEGDANEDFGFKEHNWKERYETPAAHHLTPWYADAKNANWNVANGKISGVAYSAQMPSESFFDFDSSREIFDQLYNHGASYGDWWTNNGDSYWYEKSPLSSFGKGQYGNIGEVKLNTVFSTSNFSFEGKLFQKQVTSNHKYFFINSRGFERTVRYKNPNKKPSYDITLEFAPISITVDSIVAKKRKKGYYSTFEITGLAGNSGLYLNDPDNLLTTGIRADHISDFSYARDGGIPPVLNGNVMSHFYLSGQNPDTSFLISGNQNIVTFSVPDIASGVVRFKTQERTGAICNFYSGTNSGFCEYKFKTGEIVSFDSFLDGGSPIVQLDRFPINYKQDYIVSYIEDVTTGYNFKLRSPFGNASGPAANDDKIFNRTLSGTGFFGCFQSGIIERSYLDGGTLYAESEKLGVYETGSILPKIGKRISQCTKETIKTVQIG